MRIDPDELHRRIELDYAALVGPDVIARMAEIADQLGPNVRGAVWSYLAVEFIGLDAIGLARTAGLSIWKARLSIDRGREMVQAARKSGRLIDLG